METNVVLLSYSRLEAMRIWLEKKKQISKSLLINKTSINHSCITILIIHITCFIAFLGSDLPISKIVIIWRLKINLINKLLLDKWSVHEGGIIIPSAEQKQHSLHGTLKRKKGEQVFLYLPTHSVIPAGLQMPNSSLAVRLLILVRKKSSWRSHTWNQNVTTFAVEDSNELDLAKELWK